LTLRVRKLKAEVKHIARERIDLLFNQALATYKKHPQLAERYVGLARRISMKYKVRIPKRWRLFICKGCKGFMVPGFSSRVRLRRRREPHLTFTCLKCGKIKRISFKHKRDAA
jgi:ribonuclease P protein subunit RPR2